MQIIKCAPPTLVWRRIVQQASGPPRSVGRKLPPLDLSNHFHVEVVKMHVSHVIFKSTIKIIMYYVFRISQNTNRIHYMSTTFGNYMLALSVCCTIDLVMCGRVELHLPQVTTRPAPSVPIISSALRYNNSELLYIFFPLSQEHPAVLLIKLNLGHQSSSSFNWNGGRMSART